MKTTGQRITEMHRKALKMDRRRERNILSGLAVFSCLLLGGLIRGIYAFIGTPLGGTTGPDAFTGSSLLDESAGGYVLAAILAFMAGVCLTVAILRYRYRSKEQKKFRSFRESEESAGSPSGNEGTSPYNDDEENPVK